MFLLIPTINVFYLFIIMLIVINHASLYVTALFWLHINSFVPSTYSYMSNICSSSKKKSSIVIRLLQSVSSAIL
jgi:hypothetical protein